MSYNAPIEDMLFNIKELANLEHLNLLPGFEDANLDVVESILEEKAKFCSEVISPLNKIGEHSPSSLKNGNVFTTPGFKEAFKSFGEAGWQGVQHPVDYGGQGLPKLIATPCMEMLHSANMSFALCPLLTDAAIEALMTAGTNHQKNIFLRNLISGKWTGTMNLTEPQAGSDLALIRSQAIPNKEGNFNIFGTKIYITYGDHDLSENIIHLVLARTPNSPVGVKGISLFIVPKYLVNKDGTLGEKNDVSCISLEHKLGIRASPTAALKFGEGEGAYGYLVGEENRGLEYMFIMMNAARFAVGMQGVAVAESAYQKAVIYARDRLQSRDLNGSKGPVSIINHPDVKRMLMTMKCQVEASRSLSYVTAAAFDYSQSHKDCEVKKKNSQFYEFMVPIVKGWSTELSIDVASTGIQVHGGMGFIEETGAAQFYRDARILTIYEGTTGIQANDLLGRKTLRDGGLFAKSVLNSVRKTELDLKNKNSNDLELIRKRLSIATNSLEEVINYLTLISKTNIKEAFAGSVPYLKLSGIVFGGWQMARSAIVASDKINSKTDNVEFLKSKLLTARFFADHFLSQAPGICTSIVEGSNSAISLEENQF